MNRRLSCWTKYGYSLKIHANVSSGMEKTIEKQLNRVHRSLKTCLYATCTANVDLYGRDSWTKIRCLKAQAYDLIFLPLSNFPCEDIPRHGKCNSYQCRSNGRPRERERNKVDYSASVALPWHMASIPRVPEWHRRSIQDPDKRRDAWMDVWKWEHAATPPSKAAGLPCKKRNLPWGITVSFPEVPHRFARARKCSV